MSRNIRLLAALCGAALTAGCNSGNGPNTGAQVQLSFATRPVAGAPVSLAAPDTITAGTDVLVLSSVELVVRKIEFEQETGCNPAPDSASAGGSAVMRDGGGHDGCAEVEAGPVLIDLPLGTGAAHTFTVDVPAGTYDEVKLQIHAPTMGNDGRDRAFVTAHPDLAGLSIRVTGTFNDSAFTYTTSIEAEQKMHLTSPLVVTDSSAAAVTLLVDVSQWFQDAGNLIDPAQALAGQPQEHLVRTNILASFHGFEDEDHDGADDHGHHGG